MSRGLALLVPAILAGAGCGRMEDSTANFTKSIDSYYSAHPACLWSDSVKFPVQEDGSDAKSTGQYDALVDQGLLVRTAAEKKVLVVASKEGSGYDLSAKGRSVWIPDPQQPGYGNFCYGHRRVVDIDSSSATTGKNGATTDVVYRYTVTDSPGWAKAAETQTAFPGLQSDLAGNQVGRAKLTDTRKGWEVSSAPWGHISDSDIYR